MLHNPGVTERLARLVADTRWSDLPGEVAHAAKRSLMNFFAAALTGCRTATFETALASLAGFSGGRQAALIGRRERIDALGAAFLNAAGANVLDFCDTHVPTVIHPTAPLAPALFALGELKPVSGRDVILAFVLGQEVECRIGLAMSPSHYNRGWHITATCGVFGAAAGSGKLLRLTPEQMVSALGIAATQSAGLCECLGTPAKSVGVGNAARNGLWSALLAANGFAGPAEPLAGVQGYYNALAETPKLSFLTDKLGAGWEIMKTSYKPYPCGFVVHPVLDCVLDWRRDHPEAVGREGQGHRQSAAGGPHRPREHIDQRPIASQRAARGRRRARHRQGRRRAIQRRLRQRSESSGAARQGRDRARRKFRHHCRGGRNHHRGRQAAQAGAAGSARQRLKSDER